MALMRPEAQARTTPGWVPEQQSLKKRGSLRCQINGYNRDEILRCAQDDREARQAGLKAGAAGSKEGPQKTRVCAIKAKAVPAANVTPGWILRWHGRRGG